MFVVNCSKNKEKLI